MSCRKGSIYSWAGKVKPDRPTGSGDMLHTKSPLKEVQTAVARNTWWLGICTRGLRYTNWTKVEPACYWFAAEDGFKGPRAENLRNAYAPVALFDEDYHDLGIEPYVTGSTAGGKLPRVAAGALFPRTLILYNDEFRGEAVKAEAVLRTGASVDARWTKQFRAALGEHLEFHACFRFPPRQAANSNSCCELKRAKRRNSKRCAASSSKAGERVCSRESLESD